MIPINERIAQVKQQAKETRGQVEQEGSVQAIKAAVKGQAQLLNLLTEQQRELKALHQEVTRLGRARSRGGFPWGLLLLAGGAYALYRFSPAVQDRVKGFLGQTDPGVEGNLKRAGRAAENAMDDLREGQHPGDALHRVDGEMRRAGEKTADSLIERLDGLNTEGKDAADRKTE